VRAVILAGGLGTRLREETEFRPKPMVEVGGRPIIWHIMKGLAAQDFSDFVICLGYKGDQIKDYFSNYDERSNDITVNVGSRKVATHHEPTGEENWKVTLANTGLTTMTGGRINRVRKYLNNETFLCTYGDGLANVDLQSLLEFHKAHGKIATLTAVRPTTRFGALQMDIDGSVIKFAEKPKADQWVNGGFFIFEPQIFDYLDDECILEREPLENLCNDGQLMAFQHHGFWQPMDTYRESQELNEMWDQGIPPWKTW
jgi:glucose-1-phosphate cytidylyltransferase